mmetsp:Transcript_19310/g.28573  ORF Transcript_19310/g.28573 Transcript_19310/m.28573 type:complete len:115 (-) Transcript_19310:100-444(-)|eukprot:CAMPEP_0194225632 /NCGR_PEP_ID=MMETSP0156-20130528/40051_1 /TAXON_ID=33649 /ORGANISM="Thalassionema nitzschioides, Strain L26-B" /LENGTH=114 /DNA_ID=CAMNT_0038957659 /DNA_START=133 /DNA_END=477 /DNA_ORIENTATION=+
MAGGVTTADEESCLESGVFTIADDDTIATVEGSMDSTNEDTKRMPPPPPDMKSSIPSTFSTIYEDSTATFDSYQNGSSMGYSSSYSYNYTSSSSSSYQDSSWQRKVMEKLHDNK